MAATRVPTDRRVIVKTEPTFTTDEYSQPLITNFAPWFPLALYPGSPRLTAFPTHTLLGATLPETAPRPRDPSPLATTQFRPPRDIVREKDEENERNKENDAANRWSSRRILVSVDVHDRVKHVVTVFCYFYCVAPTRLFLL